LGIISVLDLEEVGKEPLVEELKITEEQALRIIQKAETAAKEAAAEEKLTQAEGLLLQEKSRSERKRKS
jgi:hypothetical protein